MSAADTIGQLVNHTSFQFNGTVVDFLPGFAIFLYSPYIVSLNQTLNYFTLMIQDWSLKQ
jgi:heat shock protein HspQ